MPAPVYKSGANTFFPQVWIFSVGLYKALASFFFLSSAQ